MARAARRALDQLVAGHGEDAPLGHAADDVHGATDALAQDGDRARRAQLAHQLHVTDVDAELERRRRHDRAQLARLQAPLDGEPGALGQRAVMGRDHALAEERLEIVRHALAHAPTGHEHQRRLVRHDQLAEPGVDVLPGLA
jgi:hypothetical protein